MGMNAEGCQASPPTRISGSDSNFVRYVELDAAHFSNWGQPDTFSATLMNFLSQG
jgi:3-oxoadipate enol-lactonase